MHNCIMLKKVSIEWVIGRYSTLNGNKNIIRVSLVDNYATIRAQWQVILNNVKIFMFKNVPTDVFKWTEEQKHRKENISLWILPLSLFQNAGQVFWSIFHGTVSTPLPLT